MGSFREIPNPKQGLSLYLTHPSKGPKMFSVQSISCVLLMSTLNATANAYGGRRRVVSSGGNPRGGRGTTSVEDFDVSDRLSRPSVEEFDVEVFNVRDREESK